VNERTYGALQHTLDEVEATAKNLPFPDVFFGKRTVFDLVARIRELEHERAELARMDAAIRAWEQQNGVHCRIALYVDGGVYLWEWSALCDEADGFADTLPDAIKLLYDSLVQADQIPAAAATHATPGGDTK